jgi:hypothetical protein
MLETWFVGDMRLVSALISSDAILHPDIVNLLTLAFFINCPVPVIEITFFILTFAALITVSPTDTSVVLGKVDAI